jgi:tripartite-type tricarboxylate transporter receptor subunit TctC
MKPVLKSRGAYLLLFPIAAIAFSSPVAAQTPAYPAKPIRLVVPWAPGGTSDTPWRILAPKLSDALGQPVVIENRPGAAGTIGAAMVAVAKPDGYTLLGTSNVHVMSANVYKNLPYNALNDFSPIAQIAQTCSVLVTHPSLPTPTAREFIAYAKANPGKVDFSSTGNGSGQHLFMALLASSTGITLNHVPYKSVGQATAELVAGQVKASIPGLSVVSPFVADGKLRALAVTCAKRSRFMPDVPALAEAGVPGFDATLREGMMAPKGVPSEILARLETEIRKVLDLPEIQKSILATSNEPVFATSAQFSNDLRNESAKWQKLVKEIGAQAD